MVRESRSGLRTRRAKKHSQSFPRLCYQIYTNTLKDAAPPPDLTVGRAPSSHFVPVEYNDVARAAAYPSRSTCVPAPEACPLDFDTRVSRSPSPWRLTGTPLNRIASTIPAFQ